ncbi:MAG: hypothetical protein IKP02_12485 [Paludibacteraceae bacterium]|nr:hypothetical protein [Paludibacteraceae bacterium]
MKPIKLPFEGFWKSKEVLPKIKGIYFVYRATPYMKEGKTRVNIHELIYIGKAEDQTIWERHQKHERQGDFEAALLEGEELRYSTVELDKDFDRIENGLIFKRQPRLNDKLKDSFKYPDSHFILEGNEFDDMFTDFIVKKYDK